MSYRGDICDVSSFELGYFNFFSIVAVTSCKPFIDRRTPIYIYIYLSKLSLSHTSSTTLIFKININDFDCLEY